MKSPKELNDEISKLRQEHNIRGAIKDEMDTKTDDLHLESEETARLREQSVNGQAGTTIHAAITLFEKKEPINKAAITMNLANIGLVNGEYTIEENRERFFNAVNAFTDPKKELQKSANEVWSIIEPEVKLMIDSLTKFLQIKLDLYKEFVNKKQEKESKKKEKYNKNKKTKRKKE